MELPEHKAGLYLTHNEHRNSYTTAEQWAEENDALKLFQWVNENERTKAIEEDSIWTLQWYPETPVGFHALVASDLTVLLEAANE